MRKNRGCGLFISARSSRPTVFNPSRQTDIISDGKAIPKGKYIFRFWLKITKTNGWIVYCAVTN